MKRPPEDGKPMDLKSRRAPQVDSAEVPIEEKYRIVAGTPDGFDVILDILLRLFWIGTLNNDSKVILHNAANEIIAILSGTEEGGDFETEAYRGMLRAAIKKAAVPAKPPKLRTEAHDSGRS